MNAHRFFTKVILSIFVFSASVATAETVPNVVGMTETDANSAITGAGLAVGTVNYERSDTVEAGDVISQEPAGGAEITDLAEAAIGHWKLNDNETDDIVIDSSGTGNDGTASGDTESFATTGKINGAFYFDGTSYYYVDVGAAVDDLGTGSYTKAAWVKLESSASTNGHNILSGAPSHRFWAPYSYGNKLSAGHNGDWDEVQDSNSLEFGVWYFVAVTYDSNSNTLTLYKDGVVVDTGSTTEPNSLTELNIGRYDSSATYFKGTIDNVMLFDSALGEYEVAALYNGGSGTEIMPDLSVDMVVSCGLPVTYYVDPNGDDDANGLSLATAFATVQKGVNTAIDDDIVEVNEGTYQENVSVAGKSITITGRDPGNWDVIEATIIDPAGVRSGTGINITGTGASPVIKGLTVRDCHWGIRSYYTGANPEISRCIIKENDIGMSMGGSSGSSSICNNKVFNNTLGMLLMGTQPREVKNNLVYGNGGGVETNGADSQTIIRNNTIVDNSSYGIKVSSGSQPATTNCIIWDSNDVLVNCTAAYSCIDEAFDANDPNFFGSNNNDPCFVDANANDFSLSITSVQIDAGDPNFEPEEGETDIDTNPRVSGNVVDTGSYEIVAAGGGGTSGKIYYVDALKSGTGGQSWEDAFKYLQDAIDVAESDDQIWVAAGTYYPDEDNVHPAPAGSNLQTDTFTLHNGVAIYGGFEPDEPGGGLWENRDPDTYETILSGDIDKNEQPDDPPDGDNSYHVVTASGTNDTAILDGFTITKGCADDSTSGYKGGGIYNNGGSPTITDCTFSKNRVGNTYSDGDVFGGGMYNSGGSPTITDCTFSGNEAIGEATTAGDGGGMYNLNCNLEITNCIFSENLARRKGAGMYSKNCNLRVIVCNFISNNGSGVYNFNSSSNQVEITDCIFVENSKGGIYHTGDDVGGNNGDITIKNCTFSENGNSGIFNSNGDATIESCNFIGNRDASGGGIYNSNSNGIISEIKYCTFVKNVTTGSTGSGGGIYNLGEATIEGCTFRGNESTANGSYSYYGGGGIYNKLGNPTIKNCVFSENTALYAGGGIYNQDRLTITNCTFSGNRAIYSGGGGIYNQGGEVTIENSIFSGNKAENTSCTDGGGGGIHNRGEATIENCIFSGNTTGFTGGGIFNKNSDSAITNCTFSKNTAEITGNGGGIYGFYDTSVTNCILWDNEPEQIAESPYGEVLVNYSDVHGGWPVGIGNKNANPCFMEADDPAGPDGIFATADDGLRIKLRDSSGSDNPCVNAGTSSGAPSEDIIGLARDIPDMGAYEAVKIIYVDKNVAGGDESGSSWANAFKKLCDALDVAGAGDLIWVAEGTYMPRGPGGVSTDYFELVEGAGVYGGFAGSEERLSERNWTINETILSGDQVINDGPPDYEDKDDNSYHVVIGADDAVLDGFTIEKGYAARNYEYYGGDANFANGGGMLNIGVSPTVRNCEFRDNTAYYYGGGVYNRNSRAKFINCTFTGNYGSYGIGIHSEECSTEVINCVFTGNWGVNIFCRGDYSDGSSPTITNCVIADNFWDSGIWVENSSAKISNCTISRNYYEAMYFRGSGSPEITNCILWGNGCEPYFQGSGYRPPEVYKYGDITPIFRNCDIEDCGGSYDWNEDFGTNGGGNIDSDPYFVDADDPNGDDNIWFTSDDGLGLYADTGPAPSVISPCIDAGHGDYAPQTDIVGNARLDYITAPNVGAGYPDYSDIGAYEHEKGAYAGLDVVVSMCWVDESSAYTDSTNGKSNFNTDLGEYKTKVNEIGFVVSGCLVPSISAAVSSALSAVLPQDTEPPTDPYISVEPCHRSFPLLSLAELQDDFHRICQDGTPTRVVFTIDNSQSMTTETIQPAYDQLKQWITSTYGVEIGVNDEYEFSSESECWIKEMRVALNNAGL